jgi:hypothetical protein
MADDLTALREAVARLRDELRSLYGHRHGFAVENCAHCARLEAIRSVIEYETCEGVLALLDEVEAERIEVAHLRTAFMEMERGYNDGQAVLNDLRDLHDGEWPVDRYAETLIALAALQQEHDGCVAPEHLRQEREARVHAEAALAAARDEVIKWAAEVSKVNVQVEMARAVLDGAAVEFEDRRISYTTIQVDADAWAAWQARKDLP